MCQGYVTNQGGARKIWPMSWHRWKLAGNNNKLVPSTRYMVLHSCRRKLGFGLLILSFVVFVLPLSPLYGVARLLERGDTIIRQAKPTSVEGEGDRVNLAQPGNQW